MKDALLTYVKKVNALHEKVKDSEQATKHALIDPLFTLLGYNLADPDECVPEFKVDFGKGRWGEPVDWAFFQNGRPIFLVEAKKAGTKLGGFDGQLADYFAQQRGAVKLGILTNGVEWKFFTDIDIDNLMDTAPFLTWDVLKDAEPPYDFLALLQKSQFNKDSVRAFAKQQYKHSRLAKELARLLKPSDEFTELVIANIEKQPVTPNVVESWKGAVASAIEKWARQQTAPPVPPDPPGRDKLKNPDKDRAFWELKGTPQTCRLADDLLVQLVHKIEPRAKLRYTKFYIGMDVDGSPRNFVKFVPQRANVILAIKLAKSDESDEQLKSAGFESRQHHGWRNEYQVRIDRALDDNQRKVLLGLIRQAWEGRRKA